MTATVDHLLRVENLSVDFRGERGKVRVVDGVSFTLERGRTLAIVGESGSGKSMLCRAILGLLPSGGALSPEGGVIFDGHDLGKLPERELATVRGREIGVVLQNPLSSLNPVATVGRQIVEPLRHHLGMPAKEARQRAIELLSATGIPRPDERADSYPHELSGGMRQRVAIAMALACEPRLLIADEPTTALDVTVQAEILNLLARLGEECNMAMILVTHDLGVVAGRAHGTAVMYAGRIVEHAPTDALFSRMRMHYTKALFDAVPRVDDPPNTGLNAIGGFSPDLAALPPGCRFAPRCPRAEERCREEEPPLVANGREDHRYACWFPCSEWASEKEGEAFKVRR